MSDQSITVKVAKDLEDLIPTFFKNRTKELETLRAALGTSDFEQLRQLGQEVNGERNVTCDKFIPARKRR